jgi:hypothetical protein
MGRLLTDLIMDRHEPEYCFILRIGSGSHSTLKFARNDRNANPWYLFRSDLFHISYFTLSGSAAIDDLYCDVMYRSKVLVKLKDMNNILVQS